MTIRWQIILPACISTSSHPIFSETTDERGISSLALTKSCDDSFPSATRQRSAKRRGFVRCNFRRHRIDVPGVRAIRRKHRGAMLENGSRTQGQKEDFTPSLDSRGIAVAPADSLIKRLAKKLSADNQIAIDLLGKIGLIAPYPGAKPRDLWFKLRWYQFKVILPGDITPTTYLVYATQKQHAKINRYAPEYNGVRRALSGLVSSLEVAMSALDKCLRSSVTAIRNAMELTTSTPRARAGEIPPVGRCDYKDDNNVSQCADVSNDTCTVTYMGVWDGARMCDRPGKGK